MSRKCYRCGKSGHVRATCPRDRLAVVLDPPAEPAPDLSRAHAYWDRVAPLPQPEPDKKMTPAQIAREMRLRALAAGQVAESRAARAVI